MEGSSSRDGNKSSLTSWAWVSDTPEATGQASDRNLKSGQRSGLGTKGVVAFMGFESPEVMLWPIRGCRTGDEV